MMRVTPFVAADLLDLAPGATALREMSQTDRDALAAAHELRGNCFTVRGPDGAVLYCGGVVVHHAGYATLWALMADDIGIRTLGRVLVIARRYIEGLPHARVDALTSVADRGAGQWALACGLHYEATLADAAIGGGDLHIFRRVGR